MSPKSHAQLVTEPLVRSVKETVRGAVPFVGVPEKFAVGAGGVTVTYAALVSRSEPKGPLAVRATV